jgi:hypothetical protein
VTTTILSRTSGEEVIPARALYSHTSSNGGLSDAVEIFTRVGDPPYSAQSFGLARNVRSIRSPEQETKRRERRRYLRGLMLIIIYLYA